MPLAGVSWHAAIDLCRAGLCLEDVHTEPSDGRQLHSIVQALSAPRIPCHVRCPERSAGTNQFRGRACHEQPRPFNFESLRYRGL